MLKFNSQPANPLVRTISEPQNLARKTTKRSSTEGEIHLSQISVPCLNCQEIIPYKEIDYHSRVCLNVTQRVMQLEQSPTLLNELDFKIMKTKESLQNLLRLNEKLCKSEDQQKFKLITRAIEIAQSILNQKIGQKQFSLLMDELKTLQSTFFESLCVSLHLERLQSLMNSKFNYLNQNEPDFNKKKQKEELKNLIIEKKQQFDKLKILSQMYKQETQTSLQVYNNLMKIDVQKFYTEESISHHKQISSDYGLFRQSNTSKNNNFRSEILSQTSNCQSHQQEPDDDYQTNIVNGELIQRKFYSKCLNSKIKMPIDHLSQKIPISILFKEMMKNQIPQSNWDTFINDSLQNPDKYLDMKKINENCRYKNNLKQKTQDQNFKTLLQKKI